MSDLSELIEQVVNGPSEVRSDAGSVRQQSVTDLIAADKYLAAKAVTDPTKALLFSDIYSPGAV